MHASHSHNYYFIKELLPLAGALWHCCAEAGMAPEGGWGERSAKEGGDMGWWRKHAVIWVISQSAWGRVTVSPLHLI